MSEFENKVVLITGAYGGIGQAMVRYFGTRGATIAALDKNPELPEFINSICADGIRAKGAIADIGRPEQVDAAIGELVRTLGTVDVLINNAGFSTRSTLETTDPDSWQIDVNGNLNGTFNVTHRVLEGMKTAKAGAIVNIASVNGLMALGDPAYSAAKAGIINFTQSLATEYGPFGIRANVICPGTVRTPIWSERVKRSPQLLNELRRWYPLGRVAEPVDIAKAAAFLASDDASAITGVVLPVDCGLSAGNIVLAGDLTLEKQ